MHVLTRVWMYCLLGVLAASRVHAGEPLHTEIDRLIAARANGGPVAAPADDAEFVRRVFLDLAGRIPSAAEVREFLADTSADKREKLIDRLLAGPDYPRHMQAAWHVQLMERLGDHPEWTRFLRESFAANRPWDQIVRQILHPDSSSETTRGSAFFFTKRLEHDGENPIDLPALTRDVGRLFLGRDLQCAQCHDHLFVDDYKQADYQGLFTFVKHTYIRTDVKFPAVGEKIVEGPTEFMSVFKKQPRSTGPRLPGSGEVQVTVFAKGDEFAVEPDTAKNSPGEPKFSPLTILAEQLPRAENADFVRNSVNRFWAQLLGRGLVHPLDLQHAGNPASHPELLDLLTREFVEHRFDVKYLLREIALSQTYQRSSQLPGGVADSPPELFLVALERPLSAEQMYLSTLRATGEWERMAPLVEAAETEAGSKNESAQALARFVKAFSNPPREPEGEFAPSVKGALFWAHDTGLLKWLEPHDGNLADRLAQLEDASQAADELYLSVLSRRPDETERAAVTAQWTTASDREARGKLAGRLIWSLLSSTEFSVNH